ncbi:MAG: LiaF transmembrane domain-containing protein, partial [Actinomycetota bacterium]
MSTVPEPPPPPTTPPRTGRLVAGVVLVLIGVGWLLEVLDVVEFPWEVLLPAALIAVGVALLLTAR